MNPQEFRDRSKRLALEVVELVQEIPTGEAARVITRQLLRSATAVAANYRAATRARSTSEFIAKIAVVVEEADETILWLELLRDGQILPAPRLAPLLDESDQLLRIFAATLRSSRSRTGPQPRTANIGRNRKSQITNRK
jgi:four helix bundle protein